MAIIAYKAFESGLIATRGSGSYKFSVGINKTNTAKCAHSGFHCAEDPLDMFSYYSPGADTEYRLVIALGDIDEDAYDSKISCTEIEIKQQLTIHQVAAAALCFMKKHPEKLRDYTLEGYFRIKTGKNPVISGKKGELLCFCSGSKKAVERIATLFVDGKKIKPGIKYDIDGKECSN